jgi:hypothetical protein
MLFMNWKQSQAHQDVRIVQAKYGRIIESIW